MDKWVPLESCKSGEILVSATYKPTLASRSSSLRCKFENDFQKGVNFVNLLMLQIFGAREGRVGLLSLSGQVLNRISEFGA